MSVKGEKFPEHRFSPRKTQKPYFRIPMKKMSGEDPNSEFPEIPNQAGPFSGFYTFKFLF
jgi:hypothetical protein